MADILDRFQIVGEIASGGMATVYLGRLKGPAGFSRTVAVEVSTRKAANRAEREADLAEALAFARLHLAAPLGGVES